MKNTLPEDRFYNFAIAVGIAVIALQIVVWIMKLAIFIFK
jgi:hypothetical protein